MKKRIIFLSVWALTSAFTFAFGRNVFVSIEKGDLFKTVNVQLANLENQRTHVSIQDIDGKLWFSKYVWNESGFAANLNLNGMPNGDYIFFVMNREGLWTRAFSLTPEDLAFFEGPSKASGIATFASYGTGESGKLITHFTKESNMKLVVQLANLQGRPADIRIVSVGYGLVFDETVKGQKGLAHSLNLEGLNSADFFLYVRSYDTTVVQFFSIEKNELTLKGIQRMERPLESSPPVDKIIGEL